jgi:outer membrane receptor protein involved in Fe transport
VFEFSATGPAGKLPAGDVDLALGLMHKRDEYFYHADPAGTVFLDDKRPDLLGFGATDDIDGSDHNWDTYVEARLPLLAGRRNARELELQLGYRYSHYASAGGADAWKAELMYQPVEALRLRGSLQHAVRAPSVYELYLPRLPATYSPDELNDPCAAGSDARTGPDAARVEDLCLAQGVPSALLENFSPAEESDGVSGGNPALEPEAADTVTLGVVLNPSFDQPLLAQMQFGLDWYRIKIDDAIIMVDASTYVPACFDPASNPEMSVSGYWCGFFSRNSTSGTIQDFVDTQINYGLLETSGIDGHLDWQIPLGNGTVSLAALASWLDSFTLDPAHGLPREDYAGFVGSSPGFSQPQWKANVDLAYQWHAITVGTQWRYVGAMHDIGVLFGGFDYRVPSQEYWDLYEESVFERGALTGLTVRAGIENLTNEQPPLLPTPVQANTDPSQYDVLGRRYYISLTYRL